MIQYTVNCDIADLDDMVTDASSAAERFPTVDIDNLLDKVYHSYSTDKNIEFDTLEVASIINMWFSKNLLKSNVLFHLFDLDEKLDKLNKVEHLAQMYEYKDIITIIIESEYFKRIFDYVIIDFINSSCAHKMEIEKKQEKPKFFN